MGANQSISFFKDGLIEFGTLEMARNPEVRRMLEVPEDPDSGRYVRADSALLEANKQRIVDLVYDSRNKGDFFIAIDRSGDEYCGPEITPTALQDFANLL